MWHFHLVPEVIAVAVFAMISPAFVIYDFVADRVLEWHRRKAGSPFVEHRQPLTNDAEVRQPEPRVYGWTDHFFEPDMDPVIVLRLQGLRISEIAKELHMARSEVLRIIAEYGKALNLRAVDSRPESAQRDNLT